MRNMIAPIKRRFKRYRKLRRFGKTKLPDFAGHARTIKKKTPLDEHLLPIPWMTYPAICYLKQIDFSELSVFEYGSGASTQFWSSRARRVVSVEHDDSWAAKIVALALPNVELIHAVDDEYVGAGARQAPHDVIVIDGGWRYDCAMKALQWLSPNGMVILDNAERYPVITEYFRKLGLIQIDFIGPGPVNTLIWATSMFLTRSIELKPLTTIQPRHLTGMTDSIEVDPRLAAANVPGSF